jgi:hypothetical protein
MVRESTFGSMDPVMMEILMTINLWERASLLTQMDKHGEANLMAGLLSVYAILCVCDKLFHVFTNERQISCWNFITFVILFHLLYEIALYLYYYYCFVHEINVF